MQRFFRLTIFLWLIAVCPASAQYFERTFQDGFYNKATALRTAENGDLFYTVLNNEPLSLPQTLLYRADPG